MKQSIFLTYTAIAATLSIMPTHAFFAPRVTNHQRVTRLHTAQSNTNEQPTLVSQSSYITAIDILKQDMGIEIIPPEQKPFYAIGRLVATLPLEMVSGIRLADCDTLTLISQIQTRVVETTGIQSLDTIVAVRAGEYVGDTAGKRIADVARCYTEAIQYATEKGLEGIELEVNRLVPLREASGESGDEAEQQ